ncbi:hypothetical protein GQ44DRAFT_771438 [Phaeosphaeriaceae sp. PMI808]|nr:hypothetical protein GQ44DRAFT_771438 [Phaeosphaeriaceae sp. PMI808]
MQFSIISIVVALAATASAVNVPSNGTSAYYPTGTGSVKPTGTNAPTKPTSQLPFTGGASHMGSSALGFVLAGGVALML